MQQTGNLNHKFTKVEAEDKIEVTMTDAIMISKPIITNIGQIGGDRRQYRQDRGRPRCKQNYRRGNFRGNARNFDR